MCVTRAPVGVHNVLYIATRARSVHQQRVNVYTSIIVVTNALLARLHTRFLFDTVK